MPMRQTVDIVVNNPQTLSGLEYSPSLTFSKPNGTAKLRLSYGFGYVEADHGSAEWNTLLSYVDTATGDWTPAGQAWFLTQTFQGVTLGDHFAYA